MEKTLGKVVDEITTKQQGVLGTVCTDRQGLCLTSSGYNNPINAGLIHAIAQQVESLHPDISRTPVISLQSDGCNLLIKSHNKATLGVYKSS
ncbi:ragulator complex protein LAMTOR5 homolog [Tubulanus polymorphus]|uniref:ragulator complex protein LAMTOR5 homolog n=1 Tax=Tubulanus polymorphus TaxID=672921 RepID=UPI003DA28A4C